MKVTEFIRLTECSAVQSADEVLGKDNSFSVVTPARTFFLMTDSPGEKEVWMDAVINCCPLLSDGGALNRLSLAAIHEDQDEDGGDVQCYLAGQDISSELSTPMDTLLALPGANDINAGARCNICFPGGLPEPCGLCGHSPAVCVFLSTLRQAPRAPLAPLNALFSFMGAHSTRGRAGPPKLPGPRIVRSRSHSPSTTSSSSRSRSHSPSVRRASPNAKARPGTPKAGPGSPPQRKKISDKSRGVRRAQAGRADDLMTRVMWDV